MVEKYIKKLKLDLSPLPGGYEWVALLEGIYFDEMVKRISVFATGKYPEPIHIKGSKISQPLGNIDLFVEFDMSMVIGSYDPDKILNTGDDAPSKDKDKDKDKAPIDLKMKCTKKDIKMLRNMKQADAVAILFDSNQKTYIFTDGNTTIEIDQSEYGELPSPAVLSGKKVGVPVSITPSEMKPFRTKNGSVVLELLESQLESITFQGGISYSFSVSNSLKLRTEEPNLRLYSSHFLEIAGKDNVKLTIVKDDDEYWLISETKLTLSLTAKTYECLY